MEQINIAKPLFSINPISALAFYKNPFLLLAGAGSWLNIYDPIKGELLYRFQPFSDFQKIFSIKIIDLAPDIGNFAIICTEQKLSFLQISLNSDSKIIINNEKLPSLTVSDFILDSALILKKEITLIIGYAHNFIESYKLIKRPDSTLIWEKQYKIMTTEKCMLYCMSLFPEKSLVACGTVFTDILIWNYEKIDEKPTKLLFRLKGHNGILFKILWINSELLASGSDDRTIKLWKLNGEKSECIASLYGHSARIWDLAYIPESNVLISVGEDSACILWDITQKMQLNKVHGVSGKDLWRVCTGNGIIAAGSNDSSIQLFLTEWLLCQNKSLFDNSTSSEIGKNGLWCKWELPSPIVKLKERKGDMSEYIKFNDIAWELDINGKSILKYVIMLCTSKGRILKIDTTNYTSHELYYDENGESSSCVRSIPPIILQDAENTIKFDLCIISLAKGNMAIIPRNEETKQYTKSCIWKAEDGHINNIQLLDKISDTCISLKMQYENNKFEFVTCSADGSIKEWLMKIIKNTQDKITGSHKYEIQISCIGIHKTHNKYEASSIVSYEFDAIKYLICGDMIGSLHIFEKQNLLNPAAIFHKRFHKTQRIECLKIYKNRIYSIGKDGRLNRYIFVKDPQISLQLIETMNTSDFTVVNELCFEEDPKDKKENIILFGSREKYGFLWNYTDEYPIFAFACKGGNRPFSFMWDKKEKGCFIFCYSANGKMMIFNLLSKQNLQKEILMPIKNEEKPLRLYNPFLNTTFHSMEVLSLQCKYSRSYPNRVLILTGSDDTKIKISHSYNSNPNYAIKCLKTLSVHRSCSKSLELIKTPIKDFYYLLSGGGRTEYHIFEIFDEENGVRASYLSHICLKGEDDARIMCIDSIFIKGDKAQGPIFYFISGSSTGEVILMKYNIEQNKAEIKGKIKLNAAILTCKLIKNEKNEFITIIGTTQGILYGYEFINKLENIDKIQENPIIKPSIEEEEKDEKNEKTEKLSSENIFISKELFSVKVHQCGLNGFDMKRMDKEKYLVFTGADDQSVSLSIFNQNTKILNPIFSQKEAHTSSIRVTKLIKLPKTNNFIGLSSGYDQRLILWKIICLNSAENKYSCEKNYQTVHGIPDINALQIIKTENPNNFIIYLAGAGLEMLNLNL